MNTSFELALSEAINNDCKLQKITYEVSFTLLTFGDECEVNMCVFRCKIW